MIILFLIAIPVLMYFFPTFSCALKHPIKLIKNGVVDFYYYIKRKEFNKCGTGELLAYVGLFGKGKTLSAVHRVVSDYNKYDNKIVWCSRRQKFVTQRVKVISNVNLSIPYEDFLGLKQIVQAAKRNREIDDELDTLTVTLVLGDEFSVQLNSRNFKDNINPLFLNTLLTCRHYHISIFYTTQRFGQVDALLRQVTSAVISCDKLWRFQRQNVFDAWEMENCGNPMLLTPKEKTCWFVLNSDYEAYNTLACVGNLERSVKDGDMMSEEEILALQCNQPANMDAIEKPSKRFFKNRKKSNK